MRAEDANHPPRPSCFGSVRLVADGPELACGIWAGRAYPRPMLINHMKAMPGHLIRRVQQISTAIFAEELAQFDLTAVQLAALVAIAEIPDLDATRLAELICFDRATIGDVIARLERKGLIERSPGLRDKRTKRLSPTPAAAVLIAACMDRVETVQARLLAGLSSAESVLFENLLNKIVDHADSGAHSDGKN